MGLRQADWRKEGPTRRLVNALIRFVQDIGLFDRDTVRGRGAWIGEGRVVSSYVHSTTFFSRSEWSATTSQEFSHVALDKDVATLYEAI